MDPSISKNTFNHSTLSPSIVDHPITFNFASQFDIINFFRGFSVISPKGNPINAANTIFPSIPFQQLLQIAQDHFSRCQSEPYLHTIPKLPVNYTGCNWYVNDKIKYYGNIVQGKLHGKGLSFGEKYLLHASYINNICQEDHCVVEFKLGTYTGSLKTKFDDEFNMELTMGRGHIVYTNGLDEYLGDTLVFVPHGKGAYFSKDRYIVEGTFNKSVPYGNCSYNFINGATFTGDFANNNCMEGTYKDAKGNISQISFSQALIKAGIAINAIVID